MAAVAARPEIAGGLVSRGDDIAEAGDAARAQRYYHRALAIDPSSEAALDRIAVAAMMQGDARAKEDVVRRARAALERRADKSLLFDVALLQLELRRYDASADTFRRLRIVQPTTLVEAALRVVGRRSEKRRT